MSPRVVNKSVTLCFRGFENTPDQVESMIGVLAQRKGVKGLPVKEGVASKLKKSFVLYSLKLDDDVRLDDVVNKIFNHLGGLHHLRKIQSLVRADIIEVDIVLPVKKSEEQEGGFISKSTMADLVLLGASLSFQFL